MKIDFFAENSSKSALQRQRAFIDFAAPIVSRVNITPFVDLSPLERNALKDFSFLLQTSGVDIHRTNLPPVTQEILTQQSESTGTTYAAQFLYTNLQHYLSRNTQLGSPNVTVHNTMTIGENRQWLLLQDYIGRSLGVALEPQKPNVPSTRLGVFSTNRLFSFGDTQVHSSLEPDFQRLDSSNLRDIIRDTGIRDLPAISSRSVDRRVLPENTFDHHIATNNIALVQGELSRRDQKAQYGF